MLKHNPTHLFPKFSASASPLQLHVPPPPKKTTKNIKGKKKLQLPLHLISYPTKIILATSLKSTKAPNGWERSRKVEQQIMLLGGRCEGWMMAIVGCSLCSGGAVDVGVPHWDSGHIHMLENNQ